MKAESIAECYLGAFCNTFDLHKGTIGIENQFLVFLLSGRLRQVLLYDDISFLVTFIMLYIFMYYTPPKLLCNDGEEFQLLACICMQSEWS